MYKNDRYYLNRILADIEFINSHMKGITQTDLERDAVLCDSMMFRLIQISENAGRLSFGLKEQNPQIPWTDISGLRNRIVHDYGNVNLRIVHDTLSGNIPELERLLKEIL